VEGAGRREAELISRGLARRISANEKTLDLLLLIECLSLAAIGAQHPGQVRF
jgi:hypothetical protein